MARCLVLGANGFIGSHLVDALAEQNHFVRCFGRYKSKDITFTNMAHHDVEIYRGDFLSRTSLEGALKDIEYVFHFISTTNPMLAENDPLIDIETNVRMSVEFFELCAQASVKKLIFASTGGSIYGEIDTDDPVTESVCPKPVSPYAIGKLSIENYLRYFKRKHGLEYRVLRISNPYGPRQNTLAGQGVISIFLERLFRDEPLLIFGDGSMIRDYIYVEDLARMIALSFEETASQQVYNLGSGKGYSVNELIEIVEKAAGKKAIIKFKPKPMTFIQKIVLDSQAFMTDFKTSPEINIEEGVQRTWQALKIK